MGSVMKKTVLAAAAAAAALAFQAWASEVEAGCKTYFAREGLPEGATQEEADAGCGCLGKSTADNAELSAEFVELAKLSRDVIGEKMSPAANEAVIACFGGGPKAEGGETAEGAQKAEAAPEPAPESKKE